MIKAGLEVHFIFSPYYSGAYRALSNLFLNIEDGS